MADFNHYIEEEETWIEIEGYNIGYLTELEKLTFPEMDKKKDYSKYRPSIIVADQLLDVIYSQADYQENQMVNHACVFH